MKRRALKQKEPSIVQTVKVLTAADLHRSSKLYEQLGEAVREHRPDVLALVGDFLHAFDDNEGRLAPADCARFLAEMPCAATTQTTDAAAVQAGASAESIRRPATCKPCPTASMRGMPKRVASQPPARLAKMPAAS